MNPLARAAELVAQALELCGVAWGQYPAARTDRLAGAINKLHEAGAELHELARLTAKPKSDE